MNKNLSLNFFLKKDFYNFIFTSLLITSAGALILAYIAQYIFGYEPCVLCLYQRITFYLVIFLSLVYFIIKKTKMKINIQFYKFIFIICILALALNAGLAMYHSLVEMKVVKAFGGCSAENSMLVSDIEQLREILKNSQAKKCDQPELFILGLSMANWNFLFCLTLVGFYGFIISYNKKYIIK
ncbi:MAG: disulfide bond formation protein B [Alphaproteobacteria bacterium]